MGKEGLVASPRNFRDILSLCVCSWAKHLHPYPSRDDLDGQIRHMLFSWAESQTGQPGAVGHLVQALEQSDRQDVAEEVRAILELGRHKYQDSIRRTGLAPEDSTLPSTSASQNPESAQA